MAEAGVPWAMLCSAALDRNCGGMFVRCTSSTRSCWLLRLKGNLINANCVVAAPPHYLPLV